MRLVFVCAILLAAQGASGKALNSWGKLREILSSGSLYVNVADECDELSEILISMKNDVLQLWQWIFAEEYNFMLQMINAYLPIRIDLDETWARLACEIEGIETVEDEVQLVRSYGLYHVTADEVREFNQFFMMGKMVLDVIADMYKQLLVESLAWIRKTHYPDVFPIPNTSVEEVEEILNKQNAIIDTVTLLLDIPGFNITNNRDVAKQLLEAESFEESIAVEGLHADVYGMETKYLLNYFHAAQTLKFEELILRDVDNTLAFLDYLEMKGIFKL